MEEKVVKILNEMSEYLSIAQMKKLQEVMLKVCAENEADKVEIPNKDFLEMFLDAKKIEGCSERTIAVLSGNSGAFTFPNGKFCAKSYNRRDTDISGGLSEKQQLF